jgi:Fe2+ transport system protein FeoA
MSNSELATRVSGASAERGRLVDADPGRSVRVLAVDAEHRPALLSEGLDVGVDVQVERRLAFGGPLVIRVGRARLAVSRAVAAGIEVEPAC